MLHVAGLCEGNSPVTQRASNAEMFPFDDVIMNNTIFYHFVNHELSYNEKCVLRWNTVVHESSQCKYMCSHAQWVFWSCRKWQSNYNMSPIPTQLSWRKWNNVTEIFRLQYELQPPKYSFSMANVYGLVWCIFVNIISPPTRFGQYQNYRNGKRLKKNMHTDIWLFQSNVYQICLILLSTGKTCMICVPILSRSVYLTSCSK